MYLELGADAVRGGDEERVDEAGSRDVKQTGEAAQARHTTRHCGGAR